MSSYGEAVDGRLLWEYADRVHICWGKSAIGDIDAY